jgi:hypothetical protein
MGGSAVCGDEFLHQLLELRRLDPRYSNWSRMYFFIGSGLVGIGVLLKQAF